MSGTVSGTAKTDAEVAGTGLARNGKVSYMQIPALDVARSAAFYGAVFGWSNRDDGKADHRAFEDASGDLIGAWVTTRAPSAATGPLPYVYVTDIDATIAAIQGEGCPLVREKYVEGDLWVATFRDPAGNTIGLWQFQ
jgi:predicted enzyme related to lactoylglutathione lyase